MVRHIPAPSQMPSLVNVQQETTFVSELPEDKLRRLPRVKRKTTHWGLRANTNIESGAVITHFAFAPTVYASKQDASDAGYLYYYRHQGGYVAMLNPSSLIRQSDHRGVYCNHASSDLANSRMSALRPIKGTVANQRVGYEATLFAKKSPILAWEYVRTSYGPQYATQFAAATAAQFEARVGRSRNLKIGHRFPPAQEQAQLEAQTVTKDLKKAARVTKEAALKAARTPSKRVLERPDRGKLKPQRWQ